MCERFQHEALYGLLLLEEGRSSGASEYLVLLNGRSRYLVQQWEPHIAQSVSLGFSSP